MPRQVKADRRAVSRTCDARLSSLPYAWGLRRWLAEGKLWARREYEGKLPRAKLIKSQFR
jgi:hypothetical protein